MAPYQFSDEEKTEYDKIYEEALVLNTCIAFESKFPKYRFLQYISMNKQVLFHGSNNQDINEFHPRRQTLYNGEFVNAVFSTRDGIWPIFYAVFNRSSLIGNFRNGCIEFKDENRFYFFSLSKETIHNDPWTNGMVYILPRNKFTKVGKGHIVFDEWVSNESVKPILRIKVKPKDFIYLNKVSTHKSDESLLKTWLFYKLRTVFKLTF
jgi:hypothetical protein